MTLNIRPAEGVGFKPVEFQPFEPPKMDITQEIKPLDIGGDSDISDVKVANSVLSPASFGSHRVKTYGIGFTDPRLLFKSYGLSEKNYTTLNRKLSKQYNTGFNLSAIKSKDFTSNRQIQSALSQVNPVTYPNYRKLDSISPVSNTGRKYNKSSNYENVFNPSSSILLNMNTYKFVYGAPVRVLDGYLYQDGKIIKQYKEFNASPALFNPLYMVQVVGITSNVPLINGSTSGNGGALGSMENTTDCSISELVRESGKRAGNSKLGLARYRYVDFMYCKHLGKVSNNHLITLRKFPTPVGDNIFERYDEQLGDTGRLVTWFGTDDNQLENIINFSYQATWKPLSAKIEEVDSREDSESRGKIGMILNSMNPQYNDGVSSGFWGANSIFKYFGAPTSSDNGGILRNYDKNKVYEPHNTIQDTHIYEGKLQFTHEFTLKFSYELRAYDNINPKSAFLDLIGNVLAVTYRKGRFWGGDRKMIGPPQNTAGWKKVDTFINKTWEKGGNLLSALANGSLNLSNIAGAISGLLKKGAGELNTLFAGGLSGFSDTIKSIFDVTHLDKGALGIVKNALGRPALYAMDSLLRGDNVGLWHVTIGNPFNPIMSMGNLILTNASIQQSGPLGIDDFPTNLTVTVTLKHARGRDAVEVGRMFTKGTNGIYMIPLNTEITNFYQMYSSGPDQKVTKEIGGDYQEYTTEKIQDDAGNVQGYQQQGAKQNRTMTFDPAVMNSKEQTAESRQQQQYYDLYQGQLEESSYVNEGLNVAGLRKSNYGRQMDHYNQALAYDILVAADTKA